tara:strand:+ start:945 stop:2144 length:1200 start_codon:yes stop_codon:yes gene_type:complete
LKKNSLHTKFSFILAIMLLNSCATSSNNGFKLNEDQKQNDFTELLAADDLFFVNELNKEKSRIDRDLILELLKYESLDINKTYKVIEDVSDNLSPYGKNIIEGILRNTKKLQDRQATNLTIKIDEKYKKILIQASINIDTEFNLIFVNSAKNIISKNILNEALPGFCNSFQDDQLSSIEAVIFSDSVLDGKETLVIYENTFKGQERRLNSNFSNLRSVLFSDEGYEQFASNVLGVSDSSERYKRINVLLPNVKINNIPRVREDIKNIYFLMSYKNAKGLVPAFRYNYSIGINSYASSNLIESVNNINGIVDFESLIMPAPNHFGDDIFLDQFKKNASIKDRLIFDNLYDLLLTSYLSQSGIKEAVVNGRSGILHLREGKCISRKLPLKRINSEGIFTLP